MPDVLTHLATGHWLGRALTARSTDPARARALLWGTLAGSALPDLATRAPNQLLGRLVPELGSILHPLHSPLPYAVLSALVARAFVEGHRRAVLGGLLAGGLLHLLLDLGQCNLKPGYTLFFPFSAQGFQVCLYFPESSVRYVGWFAAGSVALEVIRRLRRVSPTASRPGA